MADEIPSIISTPPAPSTEIATARTSVTTSTGPEPFDRVLYLLFAGMVIFAGLLIYIEHYFKDDGQLFQVISGLLTAFSGSFFTRLQTKTARS